MALKWREAWRALRASGMPATAFCRAAWPIGREKRLTSLIRQRRAVLDTKNAVTDHLFRSQRALASLRLHRTSDVKSALANPERRRMVMSVACSRGMLEEALLSRQGVETGRTLDTALAELTREEAIARIPANGVLAGQDVVVALHGRGRRRYDVAALSRLLQGSRDYGGELRARLLRGESTGQGRSYRL
jgi:hypothetical protein